MKKDLSQKFLYGELEYWDIVNASDAEIQKFSLAVKLAILDAGKSDCAPAASEQVKWMMRLLAFVQMACEYREHIKSQGACLTDGSMIDYADRLYDWQVRLKNWRARAIGNHIASRLVSRFAPMVLAERFGCSFPTDVLQALGYSKAAFTR